MFLKAIPKNVEQHYMSLVISLAPTAGIISSVFKETILLIHIYNTTVPTLHGIYSKWQDLKNSIILQRSFYVAHEL